MRWIWLIALTGCSVSLDLSGPPADPVVLDGAVDDRDVADADPVDGTLPDSTTLDGALPDASSEPQPLCRPGEVLDTCSVCGPDGRPAVAEMDPLCPQVACPDQYRFIDDACAGFRYAPVSAPCVERGVCPDRPAECGEPIEFGRVSAGTCERVEGCVGETPPETVPDERGTPCNEAGTCDGSGRCSLPEVCLLEDVRLCRGSYDELGRTICTHRFEEAEPPRSCTASCGSYGARCESARVPEGDGCGGETVSCDLIQPVLVCVCVVEEG